MTSEEILNQAADICDQKQTAGNDNGKIGQAIDPNKTYEVTDIFKMAFGSEFGQVPITKDQYGTVHIDLSGNRPFPQNPVTHSDIGKPV